MERKTKIKKLIFSLKLFDVKISESSLIIRMPIKTKVKNSSNSASAVTNIAITIHTVIAKIIFSEINKFISPAQIFFLRS